MEQLRTGHDLVLFKNFTETIIPKQKQELVNKNFEEFETFGEISEVSFKTHSLLNDSSRILPTGGSSFPRK
jgi:hypothetical protein